jgi:hypothetical protein
MVDTVFDASVNEKSFSETCYFLRSHAIGHDQHAKEGTNIDNSIFVNVDLHYSKALPSKIDYERLSPYFGFRPNDVIQHILRQTTQLAKSTVHYPMRRHFQIDFKCKDIGY